MVINGPNVHPGAMFVETDGGVKKMIDPDLVAGDIGGLVTGRAPVEYNPGKRSAFIFRGLAIGDFALASLAYARALQAGVGNRAEW